MVQVFLSSQSVGDGHLPGPTGIPGSHSSPASSSPLPQTVEQSLSVREVDPGGQQPSLVPGLGRMAVLRHLRVQAVPVRESLVQTSLSSQLARVGHFPGPVRMAGSHSSPASSSPLPQITGQSLSTRAVAPGGQQPSPLMAAVMGTWTQAVVHWAPVMVSTVQALPSLQVVGQAPGLPAGILVSQVSPASMTPLPQQLTCPAMVFSAAVSWDWFWA